MNTKKTKIVATIGPVSANERTLTEMVRAGLDVIRINFSHGDFKEHEPKVVLARQISEKLGKPIAVMQDLSGPKFRIGDFYQERVQLKTGELITLTPEKIIKNKKRVSINYPTLSEELKVGNIIMIDDGKKKFEVVEIKNKEIVCKIIVGGETKGRRSVNLPGAYLKISSLTDKDKKDLEFGFKHKVDLIAFSFVRRAEDVQELRDILKKNKSND
jgi:pyruvate kinase